MKKVEQSFLQVTHRLNLIHIAIKVHQEIPWLPTYDAHKKSL